MKDIKNISKEEVFSFYLEQIRVSISNNNRQFLYILEDLQREYKIPDDKFKHYRKRVLDYGGDTFRAIERCLNYYSEKLEEEQGKE